MDFSKKPEEKVKNKRFSCLVNIKLISNLVDLAGSERVTEHDGSSNESSGETGYINKSLFVLGNVIHKLAEGKKLEN